MNSHCLVKLNSTTAMMIGGWTGIGQSVVSTYFLDIPVATGNGTWTNGRSIRGPDLTIPRSIHACGVLNNPGDGNRQVVVAAAGQNINGRTNSTEMWVVGSSQGWTRGPDFPQTATGATGIVSPDGKKLLFVGGYLDQAHNSKSIFQLEYKNGHCWQWTKLDQELDDGRYWHAGLLVPDSFC